MFVAFLALAAAAADAPVSSHDPSSVVTFLQSEGYRAKLSKDSAGDPMIQSGDGGSLFTVFFYNCEKNRRCEDLQFHASWDTGEADPESASINEWNRDNRFTRAYLDKDSDPHLEGDVLFTDGKLGRKAFSEHLEVFVAALAKFEEHIGWGENSSPGSELETTVTPTAEVAVR